MKKYLLLFFVAIVATTLSLNAKTVLINEGFENGIQDSVWSQEFVVDQMPWSVEDESEGLDHPDGVVQGTKRAYLRNTTGETIGYITRLVSKVMDLRPTKVYMPELSFWYANPRWGGDRDTLRVLYRTGQRMPWKVLAEYSSGPATWQRVKMELPEVGATYQIAFEGTDNLGRGIVLDSIKLQSSPECTVPHDLMTINKGAGRVNLSWVASFDADSYELIISKDTIDPDTVDLVDPTRIAFHDLVYNSTNHDLSLESGEFYLAYVRSICEDENSAWSSEISKEGPFGFFVRVAKQVPFTEGFDSLAGTEDPLHLADWMWMSNTGNPNPYVNTRTANVNTRANYSHDKSYAVIFSGGTVTSPSTFIPSDRYVYLATPALADTTNNDFAINQCQVHFWSTVYTYTGRQYGRSIIVGVMEDPEDITTFVAVDTVSVWGYASFVESIVDLGSYTGTGAYVAFVSNFDRPNLFYMDNVTIEYKREVNKVMKISVNPRDTYATISWEGEASSYDLLITSAEVDPNDPDGDVIVEEASVNTNSYLCESLEADHSWDRPYYVYVKAEGADWSYRYPFVTIASKREIPYSFDFEPNTTPVYQLPTSTRETYASGIGIFGNSGSYPNVMTNSTNSYAGSGYLYLNKRGGTDAWITLPMVDDLSEVQIKFYLNGSDNFDLAHATVGVMSNPMDINTFVPISSFKLNVKGYVRSYANFENYHGPDGVIAIKWDDVKNMTQNTINLLDEITVEELSDCVPPTNVDLEIMPDSITVSWETGLSDEWEFFLSRAALTASQRIHKTLPEIASIGGVVVADSLVWNDASSNPTFGFGNLTPHSKYYLYVRATCDREWWTEATFSTPCKDEEFPYKETFESYNVGGSSMGCWQLADYMGVDYPTIYQAGTSTSSNKVLELYSSGTIHRSVAILPTVEGSLSDMLLSFDVKTFEGTSSSKGVVIIGTMSDIEDQSTFVPFDTVYVSGSSAFTKERFVLSQYDLAHDNIALTSGLGSHLIMNSHVLIDNVELKDPSCVEAYNFQVSNLGPNSFDISWSGTTPNDQWEVKVLNTSVSIAALKNNTYNPSYEILDTLMTGKSLTVGGLESRRAYYVYVHSLCGDSLWSIASAKTTCELLDPSRPNRETFEAYMEGEVPDCWTVGVSKTSGTAPSVYTYQGSKVMRLYQSSNTCWVAAPVLKCDSLSSIMVTFSINASLNSEYGVFGVMTDPEDLSTFIPIDSIHGSSNMQTVTYDLSEFASIIPASARYCAWRGRYNTSDWVYLDDVSFVSVACPMPKPSLSALTTESVRVNSGLGVDDKWILLVTKRDVSEEDLANESYVVPESWIVYRDTLDVPSAEVFGLQGQTKYYVAAAALCEDSVVSQYKKISFMTPCQPMEPEALGTITFSEDEGFVVGMNGEMPCWIVGSKAQDATSEHIPYVDHANSYKHNDNNYLYMYDSYSSSSSYVGAYAIMPELMVDDLSKYQVNFWGRGSSSSTNGNQVIVGVISDASDLNTFVPIDTLNLSKNAWDPFSVGFENYEGDYMGNQGRNIMFLSDFGATNYVYISEVSVELIPLCRPISSFSVDSVTENSALISWKGYQNNYRLLVADRALSEAEKASYIYLKDTVVDHSDDVRLMNLQPTTNYYVYAQGICDEGDSTVISMVYASFRTECPTEKGVPLPFFDDFESYELNDMQPGCWQFRSTGTQSTWFAVKEQTDNGTKAIDLYSTSTNGSYMVVPKVNGYLESMKFSIDARPYGSSGNVTLYLGSMADVSDPTTFVQFHSINVTPSTLFNHYEVLLGEYDIMYDNLVITSGMSGITDNTYDIWVDNIGLEFVSTCNPPKMRAENTSFNSATISLIPSMDGDSLWQVVVLPESVYQRISTANITAYLDTTASITSDSTHIILTGLSAATSYYIYSRTICGGEDGNSAWTRNPLKITTLYYFQDAYYFGFEKDESWQRSMNSASDNYYIHPALEEGRDTMGIVSESYMYYPHSRINTATQLYSYSGEAALLMHAAGNNYGGYVIFPAVDEAHARSFEFRARQGYLDATTKYPKSSYNVAFEIGTIDKGTTYATYSPLATIRMDKLSSTTSGKSKNSYLYSGYTIDLDSTLIATKQLVLHLPKQPQDSSYIYIDDVIMGAEKGYSLVSLNKVVAEGSSAVVEWNNIGGPWNLQIQDASGVTIASYQNLSGVTSQRVEGLDPQTEYKAVLSAANVPSNVKYVTTDKLAFRTLCQPLEPSSYSGDFMWNFDNPYEWEANDVFVGEKADTLYYQPSCFHVGITYPTPVNGYQWLVQRKNYESSGAMTGYSANRHHEVGRNDSHALRIHTTSSAYNSYLVLPALNCNLDTMMIEFYGRCFVNYDRSYSTPSYRGKIVDAGYLGDGYSHSIVVGTLTDPSDFRTLQVIDTLSYSHTSLTANDNVEDDPEGLRYWEQLRLPLTGAEGKYIVLFQPAPGLFYLDDLSVKPIGNTLFAPWNTNTSNITSTSATLSWSVRQPQLSTVVVIMNGDGTREIIRDTIVGSSYEVTGLQAAKPYQWYVYQTAGSYDSPLSKPVNFATECVVNTPQYTCGFEIEEGLKMIAGQNSYQQTLCWTYSDAIREEWVSGNYDPYNQFNTSAYQYSHTDSAALVMRATYSSRGTSYQPYAAMPAMDVNAYDTLQVSFWIRPAYVSATSGAVVSSYTGSTYSKSVIVGTMTDPENVATFVPIDTVTYDGTLSTNDVATAANNYLYQQMKVELVGATGPYVTFMTSFMEKGGSVQKTSDYIWIDDVEFEHKQECKDPKDLTVLSVGSAHAVLHWNGIDSAGSYILQVSTDPFFADDRAFVFNDEVSSNTYTVKGLAQQTTYVWRVQALCGERWGESAFSPKANFTTSRSPYFYDPFNVSINANEWILSKSHAENVLDSAVALTRGMDNWSFSRVTSSYGLEGSHYAASGYSGDYHWLVTPNFYLPEEDSVHFSMDLALTACNTAHTITGNPVTENDMKDDYYFMIIISDDGGQTWKSENIIAKWQNTNPEGMQLRDIPSTGMQVRYSLASYAGKNVRVGLYREAKTASTTGIAIHVDNIRLAYFQKTVDYTSACQYEDIQVGDIYLSGDDTEPGIHAYPTCFYVTDAEARAGKKDSVFSLEIEVFATKEVSFADTICEGDTYTDLDFTAKDRAGVYRRKLQTVEHGCDSIVTLYLAVSERRYGEDTEATICRGETYEWNGKTYNRAGIFRDTLVSSIGCDSIETLVISYINDGGVSDTIYVENTIDISELPFTYTDPEHPYAAGQAPISYPVGTEKGVYRDTARIQAEPCVGVLVHTLTVYDRKEAIDLIEDLESRGARKVLYHENLYIVLKDEWYNASGMKVSDPRE